MNPTVALIALGALLLLTAALGVLLARRAQRTTRLGANADGIDPAELGASALGARGTVVQFSTEFCSRCPGVRRLISELVEDYAGVDFVHVDLTHRPDLANRYRLLQTPTVLLLDGEGRARTRLTGAISRGSLAQELETLTGAPV